MYLIGLIGLIIGFILGILTTSLKNKKLYQQNVLQKHTLKKNTQKIHEYQKELSNYFNQNIKLLDIIANNYQKLYQHIIKSSNILLLDHQKIQDIKQDPFHHIHNIIHHNSINTENNQFLAEVPRDYPENKQ